MKVSMKRMMLMTVGCGLALSGAGQALADSVTIPNSFTAGSAAVAAEVNANFDAVKSAVDDNDSRIAALEAQLSALQGSDLTVASMNGTYKYVLLETGGGSGTVNYMVDRFGRSEGDLTFDGAGSCSLSVTNVNSYDRVWAPDEEDPNGENMITSLNDVSDPASGSCTYTLSASGDLAISWPDGTTNVTHMSPDVQTGVGAFRDIIPSGEGETILVSLMVVVKNSQ